MCMSHHHNSTGIKGQGQTSKVKFKGQNMVGGLNVNFEIKVKCKNTVIKTLILMKDSFLGLS